ncbi:TetR family transcriptional regulator [Sodalis praecaptivus]|uniref:TetR family transcriptional regulator n=1 Tax=Sodalis praecaptivus TaxID=1239307 RepID=W0HT86_9GAMM|nr:TetR/AcrR family transcriptional regulator [Sodalis praecaptivus]AHF77036.1 TetR family transcriptional regulator [Sodalis praecaptivus]
MATATDHNKATLTHAGVRPGGRSARVQAAIHRAVRELEHEQGRSALTVPAIAARAGVTPSTIYRRWGDLPQLLSDVAVENLRPDNEPRDMGSFRQDVQTWLEQFIDEMSSEPGLAMMRDVMSAPLPANAKRCAGFTIAQLDIMRQRAFDRGEKPVDSERLIDRVIAPIIYRILFAAQTPDFAYASALLESALTDTAHPGEAPTR